MSDCYGKLPKAKSLAFLPQKLHQDIADVELWSQRCEPVQNLLIVSGSLTPPTVQPDIHALLQLYREHLPLCMAAGLGGQVQELQQNAGTWGKLIPFVAGDRCVVDAQAQSKLGCRFVEVFPKSQNGLPYRCVRSTLL